MLVSSEVHPAPEMPQLSQTFSRKKWKTSFLSEDQKVELVIRLFSDEGKYWEKISRWANLANFHPIWFKFGTEVVGKPLNKNRMFEVAATIFRPTSPTNQNRPIAKILNLCFPSDLDEIWCGG